MVYWDQTWLIPGSIWLLKKRRMVQQDTIYLRTGNLCSWEGLWILRRQASQNHLRPGQSLYPRWESRWLYSYQFIWSDLAAYNGVREMRHFEPATLHRAFEKCLETGMYNAKDFIALCDRIGKRIPVRESSELLHDILPDAVKAFQEYKSALHESELRYKLFGV